MLDCFQLSMSADSCQCHLVRNSTIWKKLFIDAFDKETSGPYTMNPSCGRYLLSYMNGHTLNIAIVSLPLHNVVDKISTAVKHRVLDTTIYIT